MGGALIDMGALGETVKDPTEFRPRAQRPIHREGRDAENLLEFVEQFQRRLGRAVHLVDESKKRNLPVLAHVEKLARLWFDPLGGVDDDHGKIHRCEHTVSVLGKVMVPRRVQQVDRAAAVFEIQHGRTDRNPAFFLQLHPVRLRGGLLFFGRDRTRQMNRPAVEEEFLGQGRFSRVRVRDDGKCAAWFQMASHATQNKQTV